MGDEAETVEFEDVTALNLSASGKALWCRFDQENGKRRPIPVSLIHDDSEVWKPGQTGKLILPEWWCIKEGLV